MMFHSVQNGKFGMNFGFPRQAKRAWNFIIEKQKISMEEVNFRGGPKDHIEVPKGQSRKGEDGSILNRNSF